jgi:ElaB/YqjD/DUF883 family membrane-anchored ribosome-binding protein
MDNETEVILEQMEGTRASLAQKLETLENQVVGTIHEATSTVSETVQQVKDAVTDTVETVKDTVEGTVETVKDTVQDTVETVKDTFDIRRQVENHPWLLFGGSFAVGFVAAQLMQRYAPQGGLGMPCAESVRSMPPPSSSARMEQGATGHAYDMAEGPGEERAPLREPQQERHGLLDSLTIMLGPELGKLKGLALGATLGIVRDLVTQSAPPELGSQLADIVNGFTTRLGGEVIPGPVLQSFTGDRSSQHHDQNRGSQEPAGAAQHAFRTGNNH